VTREESHSAATIVVSYERVSDQKQDIRRQTIQREHALAAFPDAEHIVIQDDGVSASKLAIFDRQGGAELCRLIELRRVIAIFTDGQERLSRGRQSEWWTFADLCLEAGTRIFLDGTELDLDDDAGEIISAFYAMAARREVRELSRRVRQAMPQKQREHGRKFGGRRRYGRNRDRSVRWAEAQTIRELIAPWFLAGQKELEIARHLNEDGIRSAEGGLWHAGTVAKLLRRPDLGGLVRVEGELIQGMDPKILDRETWDAIQEVFALRGTATERRGRTSVATFLLDDPLKVVCGICGGEMGRRSGKLRADGTRQASYVCLGRDRSGPEHGCGMRRVPRENLDALILGVFERDLLDEHETLRRIEEAQQAIARDSKRALTEAQRELMQIDAASEQVERDYLSGQLSAAAYSLLVEHLPERLEAARAEVERLKTRTAEMTSEEVRLAAEAQLVEMIREIRELAQGLRENPDLLGAIRLALARVVEEVVVVDADLPLAYLGAPTVAAEQEWAKSLTVGDIFEVGTRLHGLGVPGRRLCAEIVPRADLAVLRPIGEVPAYEPDSTYVENRAFTSQKTTRRPRRTTRSSS
jgi:DNA invertase Pin-like site-specific DNA recombinase